MLSIYELNHKYKFYDETKLQEEDKKYSGDKNIRIFFEGPVKMVSQELNGAIYELKKAPDCIIKVPNMTHLRLTEFPYPEYYDILAPVIDRRFWGEKKIVHIISGLIPKEYIRLDVIQYYIIQRKTYG